MEESVEESTWSGFDDIYFNITSIFVSDNRALSEQHMTFVFILEQNRAVPGVLFRATWNNGQN